MQPYDCLGRLRRFLPHPPPRGLREQTAGHGHSGINTVDGVPPAEHL
jgi:hypothetical protein